MKKLIVMLAVVLTAVSAFAATTTENLRDAKTKVAEALQSDMEDYYWHQNLLFRVEELNDTYVAFLHDYPFDAVAALPELAGKFASNKYGDVDLLEVISILENYDWNSAVSIKVGAQELKKDLSNIANKTTVNKTVAEVDKIIAGANLVREAGVKKADNSDFYWQNLMGAVENLEYEYSQLKAKDPKLAVVALKTINTKDYKHMFGTGSLLDLMEAVDSHLLVTELQTPNLYRDLNTLK